MTRPRNAKQRDHLEASGQIRASRFVKSYAKTAKPIDLDVVYAIHERIFQEAWKDIAGKNRTENVRPRSTGHMPPHHTEVPRYMNELGKELGVRMKKLPKGRFGELLAIRNTSEVRRKTLAVISVAAWVQHRITWIHPFRDGNGRTARFLTDLILQRFGFYSISIKVTDKERYLSALSQADKQKSDYRPLENMVIKGLAERYKQILQA